jgi:hypothetical protein
MSATLGGGLAEDVQALMASCQEGGGGGGSSGSSGEGAGVPLVVSEGRSFPVQTVHLGAPSEWALVRAPGVGQRVPTRVAPDAPDGTAGSLQAGVEGPAGAASVGGGAFVVLVGNGEGGGGRKVASYRVGPMKSAQRRAARPPARTQPRGPAPLPAVRRDGGRLEQAVADAVSAALERDPGDVLVRRGRPSCV